MTTEVHNVPLQIVHRGAVPRAASTYAAAKVERLLRRTQDPVHGVRLVLDLTVARTHRHPARVEIGASLTGTPIRVDVTATTLHEATDLAIDVLRGRLKRLRDVALERRTRPSPDDDERRRRTLDGWRADPGLAERPVVKRKAFTLLPMTADEAAAEMALLDHDFYLYVDRSSGRNALLHRDGSGGCSVTGGGQAPVPELTTAEAKERLALSGERFLLFHDTTADEDRVLYRRYDGALGLLVAS